MINLCLRLTLTAFLLLSVCPETYILGHSFERRAYRFVMKATQGMVFHILQHKQDRHRMVNTFLMVSINPIYKR